VTDEPALPPPAEVRAAKRWSGSQVPGVTPDRDARVVEQVVQTPVRGGRLLDQPPDILLVGHVDSARLGPPAVAREGGGHPVGVVAVDVGDDDPRTAACQLAAERRADPGASPGHDGDLVFEAHGLPSGRIRRDRSGQGTAGPAGRACCQLRDGRDSFGVIIGLRPAGLVLDASRHGHPNRPACGAHQAACPRINPAGREPAPHIVRAVQGLSRGQA